MRWNEGSERDPADLQLSRLCENIDDLHIIANGLLEYETLSGDEIEALLKGDPPHRPEPTDTDSGPGALSAVPSVGKSKNVGDAKPQST